MLFIVAAAYAYEAVDFECCHVPEARPAPTALKITLVPPADRRSQLIEDMEDAVRHATRLGVLRGGYGNPFPLHGQRPTRDYVADAVAAQLRALGHTVTIAAGLAPAPGQAALPAVDLAAAPQPAAADLIVHGTLTAWQLDISSYGTKKLSSALDLFAVVPGNPAVVWSQELRRDDQGGGASIYGGTAVERAKEWYGKGAPKYMNAALTEIGLIALVSELGKAGSAGGEILATGTLPGAPSAAPVAATPGAVAAPGAGCAKDTDCKGERICEAGACVAP
ncbi:MAG: hypothetical protein V4850_16410 [Myxococcota bacterium]